MLVTSLWVFVSHSLLLYSPAAPQEFLGSLKAPSVEQSQVNLACPSLSSLSFSQTGSSLLHTLLKTKLPITTQKQPDGSQLSIRSSRRFSRGSAEKILFILLHFHHLSNFGWDFIVSVWKVIWFCNECISLCIWKSTQLCNTYSHQL